MPRRKLRDETTCRLPFHENSNLVLKSRNCSSSSFDVQITKHIVSSVSNMLTPWSWCVSPSVLNCPVSQLPFWLCKHGLLHGLLHLLMSLNVSQYDQSFGFFSPLVQVLVFAPHLSLSIGTDPLELYIHYRLFPSSTPAYHKLRDVLHHTLIQWLVYNLKQSW